MPKIFNGIPAGQVADADWQKSTFSGAQGNCVEVAELPTGTVAMRNSRDPDGPALVFTREEMTAFLSGVKHGEFDEAGSGDLSVTNVLPHGRPDTEPETTTNRYRVVGAELQRLTDTLAAGDTVLDRESAERLLRILGGVSLLHRMHRVDRNGHCAICRAKHKFWQPGTRHDICSVYAALSLHIGRALVTADASQQSA